MAFYNEDSNQHSDGRDGEVIAKTFEFNAVESGNEELGPQFWYEWGDEPRGKVSTGAYSKTGVYYSTGLRDREITKRLPFNNPHP